ncbi:MAG TPA: monovalent cation/H(+) antiporter subunit G [Phycisphaerae bacterium]|nr:monovalent cation/H(+) antiporter subunit G [Phycisphaerae bacterium]HUT60907.1 monovalent cation/H(+) antiporter subunit G [Phycisphaerae bacterium]
MLELSYVFIGIGLAFDLLGCIGLVRLPDVYNRAQAATKCVTLGTCMILIGVACLAFSGARAGLDANASMGVKAIICAVFILLTSPVGAHAICRGAYISGVPLWSGSVEDAFAQRAETIRREQAQADKEGSVESEEAQAS